MLAATQLKESIDSMKNKMALITKLRHPGIRTRHWKLILSELGMTEHPPEDTFTLAYILDLRLEQYSDTIVNVTDFARNEHTIESALDKMVMNGSME